MADIKTNIPKTAIRREANDWCLRFTVTLCMLTAIASFGVINYLQFNEIWNLKLRVQQLEKSCMFGKAFKDTGTQGPKMERIRDKREIVPTDSMSDLITSLVQQEVGERLSGIIDGKWDEAKRAISQNQPCCLALSRPKYLGKSSDMVEASVGQSVLLPCRSSGYPPPSVTFNPMLDPTGQNRYSVSPQGMHIQSVQLGDSGRFFCRIENIFGAATKYIDLIVSEPVIATTNPSSVNIKENDRLTITCDVSGTPPPNVTWTHRRPDGKIEPVSAQMQGKSSVVAIFPAHPVDAGSYTCTGTNQRETDSSTTVVTISGKPQIVDPPKSQTTLDGSTVTLHCGIVANPPGTVTWTYPLTGSKPPLNAFVNPDNSVTLTGVDAFNTGTYTCTAINAMGSFTASANLTVEQGLGVIVTPHVYPITGSEVIMDFQCLASGTPAPTKQWLKDGTPLAGNTKFVLTSGGTLIVTGVDVNTDTGNFQCKGSNKKGTESDTTTVYKDNGQLTCMTAFNETSCSIGQLCGAKCPSYCPNQGQVVYGFQEYEAHSTVCIAAEHTGTLPNTDNLVLWRRVGKPTTFAAVLRNGIQSASPIFYSPEKGVCVYWTNDPGWCNMVQVSKDCLNEVFSKSLDGIKENALCSTQTNALCTIYLAIFHVLFFIVLTNLQHQAN